MKKVLLTTLISLIGLSAIGQDKGSSQTNSEKFTNKSGTLIEREFVEIGNVKKAKIRVIHIKDLISNDSLSSIQIEYDYVGKYTSDTKIAALDEDEIDGLIQSIKIMQERVFPTIPGNYTEVTYRSRGGFEAGCYWSTRKKQWSTYLKLEKYDGKSYVFLDESDFPALVILLEQAKAAL